VRFIPELPLLRRELTELANRRRTYIVRVAGAVVILFYVFINYEIALNMRQQMSRQLGAGGPLQFLGVGGDIFASITPVLFYTVQLLMPALACASVTSEKESNTIGTLLLTKLSPGTIVIEKFGSRLIPMLTVLLLTFPVIAYVHSLGGVDTDMLISTIWLLLCECFLIASVAILFSTYFATTVTAFIWSYATIMMLMVLTLSLRITSFMPSAIWQDMMFGNRMGIPAAQMAAMRAFGGAGAVGQTSGWVLTVARTVPALLITAMLLLTARLMLVRRAFISQSSFVLKVFRSIDAFFKALNERTTGGIEIISDKNPLPENDPVAWRERNKKSLGKARYLFRVLVVLEVPTLFVCAAAATTSSRAGFQGLYALQLLVWVLAALVASVKGATLFSTERAKQTIEPLLASPMTAAELIQQKVAGMRRLLIVLAIPILSVNFTHFLLNSSAQSLTSINTAFIPVTYFLLSIWGTFVLLYVVAWLTAGLGLTIHSPTKAILAAVSVIVVWTVSPIIAAQLLGAAPPVREIFLTFSPYGLIEASERYLVGRFQDYSMYRVTDEVGERWWMFTLPLYTVGLLVVWRVVLWRGPQLLQRAENAAPLALTVPTSETVAPALEGTR